MIRPAQPSDTPELVAIAAASEVFKPLEIVALREVLDDFHSQMRAFGHRCAVLEEDGGSAGFVYYAPADMTEGTWYVYWIAVRRGIQARGLGGALLHHAEDGARAERGRLMLIETSSLPRYELTRRFYLKHGYELAASVADFYADGDDLVVFRKRL